MITRNVHPDGQRSLRPIEKSWELMNVARQSGVQSSLYLASRDLYSLHGRPFGGSDRAVSIWITFGLATTTN